MSSLPELSYVQARLQARHGERLHEADWRVLEAANSAKSYIERARSTSLRRFADHVGAEMSSHAIERAFRHEWRGYVREVASWAPRAWQPAVLWVGYMPDLPLLQQLLKGETPDWLHEDALLGSLAGTDLRLRSAKLKETPLSSLSEPIEEANDLAERWLAHWHILWPGRETVHCRQLERLSNMVRDHVGRIEEAGEHEKSGPYRQDLAGVLTRLFRQHSATPVAIFCHLGHVALDLERLRGGLVRRLLFYGDGTQEAA